MTSGNSVRNGVVGRAGGDAGGGGEARFEVWGCLAHLLVGDAAALPEAEHDLRRLLDRIDRACSRFRADSALSRLNAAAGRTTVVDPTLLAAIEVALTAADQSGGLVDPTVGRALAAIGYDRDVGAIPADDRTPVRPVPAAGWRAVTVDRGVRTVTVPSGTALDLGATAKAWAADLAATRLAERLGCPVLVNLGGDLAVAGGTRHSGPAGGSPVGGTTASGTAGGGGPAGGNPDGSTADGGTTDSGPVAGTAGGPPPGAPRGWRVRVTEDHRAGREAPGQVVTIRSGGLATSSRTVRAWRRAGRPVHHLIDPRTGLPAAGTWRCVSVAAADCVGANTAATAAMILGPAAPDWLAARALPARLVAADGSVHTVAGWPAAPKGVAA